MKEDKTADDSSKDIFIASLGRCSQWAGFIPAFYSRFLESSDEIRERFRDTNFEQQNRMLAKSLELAAAATAGDPAGLQEMRERATTHSRTHLNIPPPLYDVWLSAILATASEFDAEWSEEVDRAWRRILEHVIHFMTRSY
jgi:hemoglobin-like flavoprotein